MVLETERLVMRNAKITDSHLILNYFKKNWDFLKKWEIMREDKFFTLEYQLLDILRNDKLYRAGICYRFWIFKKEGQKIIGSIALNNIFHGNFLSCSLGYRLDKDEVNKGYTTEAVKRVIKLAFDELGLHRIEANIMPENLPSMAVVIKCGFQNEGLAKKYLKINGKWEDHVHMTLLNKNLE
jgi:ribosomal-protein-alanine N-acetyltransferase